MPNAQYYPIDTLPIAERKQNQALTFGHMQQPRRQVFAQFRVLWILDEDIFAMLKAVPEHVAVLAMDLCIALDCLEYRAPAELRQTAGSSRANQENN
jgi:hypothetical protein